MSTSTFDCILIVANQLLTALLLVLSHSCSRYRYYIFLNSSVKGPFWPSYLPSSWHWTQAYLQKMQPHTKGRSSSTSSGSLPGMGLPDRPIAAVGSSLVCLPKVDAGRSWGGSGLGLWLGFRV